MTGNGSTGKAGQPRPVRQWQRILVLRLLGLALIPLVLCGRPVWQDGGLASETLEPLGGILLFAAIFGRFWAILYIGAAKNRTVMQDGPYSLCRHPLYLFSTIGATAFGLLLSSVTLAALIGGATFAVLWITARREERYLRGAFGPAYDDYAARVPRILPRLSGFSTPPRITADVRALRGNFADALVFLALIPLAELIEAVQAAGHLPTFPIW
ncbi:methyltransferase family protein [Wenxinia saemankumensis]|uniref:methyltransferase family protein n=1 Tax=Wenxinia saemankumensis TaxID=1447782 RepID=UPI001FCD10DD|nr:isoprenylcysteine carboxylmethyltransferase family protein [Wenxinia saemankumensis]